MTARQFGCDSGDTYGRHALRNPGGDNRQIDVLRIIGYERAERYIFHPTRVADNYMGCHRAVPGAGPAGAVVRYGDRWVLLRSDGTTTAPVMAVA